jgi:5-methylcytosine-specific restriction enzyme subunit McrC
MEKPFVIKEQGLFSEQQKSEICRFVDFKTDFKLGLGFDNCGRLWSSYYIGLDWIKENECYIAVEPKLENLDYVQMLVHCLHHAEISKFIKRVYNIDFQKKPIETQNANWDLTPFLVVHFLSVVDSITKQGLKSNYIIRDENLNGKIKGKILFARQLKNNIVLKREDRIHCRFQEYSTDCLENRLLKKVLLFIQRYTATHLDKEKYKLLFQKQNRLLSIFHNVSENISQSEIKRIKVNALYKEYHEAIDLGKKILRRFGYSYINTYSHDERKLPPFWIDMSKLFELYVYSLLKDSYGSNIIYQLSEEGRRQTHGHYGDIDFMKLDEKLLIDTKYKQIYAQDRKYDIDNIRQLSGYARDWGVLKKLNVLTDNEVIDCVIVYPDKNSKENFKDRKIKETSIGQFTKFYKCGIRLPFKMTANRLP